MQRCLCDPFSTNKGSFLHFTLGPVNTAGIQQNIEWTSEQKNQALSEKYVKYTDGLQQVFKALDFSTL